MPGNPDRKTRAVIHSDLQTLHPEVQRDALRSRLQVQDHALVVLHHGVALARIAQCDARLATP